MTQKDRQEYTEKKQRFANMLTVYGRKPVLEVLQDKTIPLFRLHMASSNQHKGIVAEIEKLATQRGVDIVFHSREALSRISKNRKQDQGVALDIQCPNYQDYTAFIDNKTQHQPFRLIALDRITNPQNLGMIIRSVCASPMDGLLLPTKGCAPLSPLVIKASAGTLFRCPILRCENLEEALNAFKNLSVAVCTLRGDAGNSIADYQPEGSLIYVLGNETEGISPAVQKIATDSIRIPMCNGVESLNVAVTAALIAFREVVT